MNNHTKHLSFLFPVPSAFFNNCVKVVKPYEINIHYTLDWRGVVNIEGYAVTPGMCRWIADWVKLEEQMQYAAEHNSKLYRRPGQYNGGHMRPEGVDSYQDIHDQWKRETGY